MLGFDQFIDQPGSRREADATLLPARRHTEAGEQMRLSNTAFADEQDRLES